MHFALGREITRFGLLRAAFFFFFLNNREIFNILEKMLKINDITINAVMFMYLLFSLGHPTMVFTLATQ